MCCYPFLLDFWLYVMETNFSTAPKPTKPIKPTFYRLWGFMLDMFGLDGGLKAQSLCKVVFSEMRDSQMGETNLFTHENWKSLKSLFYWFCWFGHHTKVCFTKWNQHTSINRCSTRQKQRVATLSCWTLILSKEKQPPHRSQANKTNKTNSL